MFIGQRVRHQAFGFGTVRAIPDARLASVWFDILEAQRSVDRASLVAAANDSGDAPARSAPSVDRTPLDPNRLAVECLRQGLPAPGQALTAVVGNAQARASMDAAIERAIAGEGSVLTIRAPYGQGKTFTGQLGRELAAARGMVTLHAELDGQAVTLSEGTRLLSALFAAAQMPRTASDAAPPSRGLGPILERAAAAATRGVPESMEPLAPLLASVERWTQSEEVIETLEQLLAGCIAKDTAKRTLQGALNMYGIRLPSLGLTSGKTAERQICQAEQLARIVHLARMAGATGAFVVMDELDEDFKRCTVAEHRRKQAMLNALAASAERSPMVILLLARDTCVDGAEEINLAELSEDELRVMVDQTIDGYARAYPLPALSLGRPQVFATLLLRYRREHQRSGWGPRFFVRAAIESCEVVRQRGLASLADVPA